MASIPIAGDLIEVIGPFAERVENRGLLLDKFSFHKQWGLGELKANDAYRWTLLRISDGGPALLAREVDDKKRQSQRLATRNPEKAERLLREAAIAASLASNKLDSSEVMLLRAKHTRRFISLFRSAFNNRVAIAVGQLEGRLAINLADSLIQNAGISLDHLFGLPFIPGSAVKGVCRHAALEELKSAKESARAQVFEEFRGVLGTAENDFSNGALRPFRDLLKDRPEDYRGRVSFLPAYPVNDAKVVVDLTNVHYPDYYRSGRMEDLSNEKPLPNPFPAVERGAQFAFLLLLNRPDVERGLLEAARRWLEAALTVRGVGAKTASGYGWFSLQPAVLQQILDEEQAERESAERARLKAAEVKANDDAEAARIASMHPSDAARERFSTLAEEAFAKAVLEMDSLSTDEQKGLLLALLSPERKDAWKRWKKSDKPASKARVEALLLAAKTHGVTLP